MLFEELSDNIIQGVNRAFSKFTGDALTTDNLHQFVDAMDAYELDLVYDDARDITEPLSDATDSDDIIDRLMEVFYTYDDMLYNEEEVYNFALALAENNVFIVFN